MIKRTTKQGKPSCCWLELLAERTKCEVCGKLLILTYKDKGEWHKLSVCSEVCFNQRSTPCNRYKRIDEHDEERKVKAIYTTPCYVCGKTLGYRNEIVYCWAGDWRSGFREYTIRRTGQIETRKFHPMPSGVARVIRQHGPYVNSIINRLTEERLTWTSKLYEPSTCCSSRVCLRILANLYKRRLTQWLRNVLENQFLPPLIKAALKAVKSYQRNPTALNLVVLQSQRGALERLLTSLSLCRY